MNPLDPTFQKFELSSGLRCQLVSPRLPWVRNYYALALESSQASESDTDELWALAHQLARKLALRTFHDPECFTLLYNAGRTRRQSWSHIHIILARSPREKRWTLFCLGMKRFLRWRRWPITRRLRRAARIATRRLKRQAALERGEDSRPILSLRSSDKISSRESSRPPAGPTSS